MADDTGSAPFWPSGDGNDAYLDKVLRYRDIELSLDESVSMRLLGRLWLHAAIGSVLTWSVLGIPGFALVGTNAGGAVTAASSSMFSNSANDVSGATGAFSAGVTLLDVACVLGFIVFWVVLLFSKLKEPIAEWRVLLADRAQYADSVYSQVAGTLWRRRLPLRWQVRRIRAGDDGDAVHNRLVVTYRSYSVYVTVFPYGTSLYLGWMMWRSRRGGQLIAQYVNDVFNGLSGGRDPERQMMRTERPRAMREALHAASREGLFVAAERRNVPLEFGFRDGQLPPVEDADVTAPVPDPVR